MEAHPNGWSICSKDPYPSNATSQENQKTADCRQPRALCNSLFFPPSSACFIVPIPSPRSRRKSLAGCFRRAADPDGARAACAGHSRLAPSHGELTASIPSMLLRRTLPLPQKSRSGAYSCSRVPERRLKSRPSGRRCAPTPTKSWSATAAIMLTDGAARKLVQAAPRVSPSPFLHDRVMFPARPTEPRLTVNSLRPT